MVFRILQGTLHCGFASENRRIQRGNVRFDLRDYDIMFFSHCDFVSENLRIQLGNVWFGLHDYGVMFFCILQGMLNCDFASENLRIQIGNVWFGLQEYDVSFAFFTGFCTVILLFLFKNPIMKCLVWLD